MKKKTIADKLAEKSFQSAAFQQSWEGHMRAFGPILRPAFAQDYQAKVHLCAALNAISRRELQKGMNKLNSIESACMTDADKAAWLYFKGLCFEMAGMKDEMISFYQQAAQFGHKFFLPYLKVAKAAHNDAVYEVAEENYHMAIECLEETPPNEQVKYMLASAYANLGSCLVTMHRYEEGEKALIRSAQISEDLHGQDGTWAVIYALRGEKEKALAALEALNARNAELYEPTKEVVDKIINETHPHFFKVEMDTDQIHDFWCWFLEQQESFKKMLKDQDYDTFFAMMQLRLKEVFDYMERDLELAVQPEEAGFGIVFADFYMVSLNDGYAQLLDACPEELKEYWNFEITH